MDSTYGMIDAIKERKKIEQERILKLKEARRVTAENRHKQTVQPNRQD